MELSKKTTILMSPKLHDRLSRIAAQKRTSMGDLIRTACERQYASPSLSERREAVRKLSTLRLPVASPRRMKQESVSSPEDLLP